MRTFSVKKIEGMVSFKAHGAIAMVAGVLFLVFSDLSSNELASLVGLEEQVKDEFRDLPAIARATVLTLYLLSFMPVALPLVIFQVAVALFHDRLGINAWAESGVFYFALLVPVVWNRFRGKETIPAVSTPSPLTRKGYKSSSARKSYKEVAYSPESDSTNDASFESETPNFASPEHEAAQIYGRSSLAREAMRISHTSEDEPLFSSDIGLRNRGKSPYSTPRKTPEKKASRTPTGQQTPLDAARSAAKAAQQARLEERVAQLRARGRS